MNTQKENELKAKAANIAAGLSEIRISLARLSQELAEIERDRYIYIAAPEPLPQPNGAQPKERKRKRIPPPEIAPAELLQTLAMESK